MTHKPFYLGAAIAGAAVGVVIGASLLGTANAATPSPTPGSSTTPGRWHSNTNPTHEAGESAARAAAESKADATGIAPEGWGRGGPDGHSNTDPAHEAKESAARAAQEKSHDAAIPSTTPSG